MARKKWVQAAAHAASVLADCPDPPRPNPKTDCGFCGCMWEGHDSGPGGDGRCSGGCDCPGYQIPSQELVQERIRSGWGKETS
jgi:hypothetical protein